MSRFLTRHEIKKNEKLLNEDRLLNASLYKTELKDAINIENHRINIDSAKKKAVIQGMNYDGFHQMVLGADLKGVKSAELFEFKPKGIILNSVLTQQKLAKETDFHEGNFVKSEQIKNELKFDITSLKYEDTTAKLREIYRNFRKSFKSLKTADEKIQLLLTNLNFEEMINCDILESDFFLEIIFNIGSYIVNKIKEENNLDLDEIKFLFNCLTNTLKHKNYSNLKKFIGKKHKALYTEIKEKNKFTDDLDLINNIIDLIIN
jgi:hypothetical protein